jgi:hypothetical protein
MNIIEAAHREIKNCYSQVDKIAKNDPLAVVIYSVALKIIALTLSSFYNPLAVGFLMFSLFFDMAIILNFKEICSEVGNKFFLNVLGINRCYCVDCSRSFYYLVTGVEN